MSMTDEELYDRYLKRQDEADIRVLFERHKEGLLLFINGFVHNLDDAEELMIDSFAQVAAGRTLFSRRSAFKTWLFSIGKKQALMHLRRARKYEAAPIDEETPGTEQELPELQILQEEQKRQLYRGLKKIPADYSRVLTLIYFEEMSHDEAARVMGKSKKQIYHLVERGKKALRETLEQEGYVADIAG
ncbi:MAG: RNA polymerase sigma factor [Clostridiales bacterium]|nr:RNA polymerase sigma factor [Clostridiales bacterium]